MEEIQQEVSKKELRTQRRDERRSAEESARRRKKITRVVWWIIGIGAISALIGGIVWAVIANKPAPLGEDFSRAVPHEGAAHVTEGEKVTYRSNLPDSSPRVEAGKAGPPTSGNHWPDPLRDGVYDEEKPDEAIVHSMEHGRVWLSYRPDISDNIKDRLRAIAKREARVILTPRAANTTDIALAAWNRLDAFDLEGLALSAVEGRVRDFIRRYRDKGPEYVPQMIGKSY